MARSQMDTAFLRMQDTQRKTMTKDEKRVKTEVYGIFKNMSINSLFALSQDGLVSVKWSL